MNRVSYSQYKTWVTCPEYWKLKYVDKLDHFNQSIHTIFGTSTHLVIQEWLENILFNDEHSLVYAQSVDLSDRFKEILIKEAAPHIHRTDKDGNETVLFTKAVLEEFYQHGCLIISYIQQHQAKVFPTENIKLHSIEHYLKADVGKNLTFVGYIDIVTYNEKTEDYVLYDLKTSGKGWSNYKKKDKSTTDQLIIYKKFFSELYDVPLNKIHVSYVILKRELTQTDFPNPRVSEFVPSNGTVSVNRAWKSFQSFIDTCFNEDGSRIPEQRPDPSKSNCRFCPFNAGVCDSVYDEKKELRNLVRLLDD
jgi:hypothetical protein